VDHPRRAVRRALAPSARRASPLSQNGDCASLKEVTSCSTLSYVKETITVRLDKDVARLLARAVKLSRRTQSEVIRDALRRQLAIDVFDQLRRRVAPFAEAQGLLTDEDVFNLVS